MLEEFYETVQQALKTQHVIVFVDNTEEQTKRYAQQLFTHIDDSIQDRMNTLEVVSINDTFLCVRRLMEIMPPINNSKYKLLLMPSEE